MRNSILRSLTLVGLVAASASVASAQCEVLKLTAGADETGAPTASAYDYFGVAVDTDGDRCVVGAYGDDATATDGGAAYVYDRIGVDWVQAAILTSSGVAANDQFAREVAIDGDHVAVGAWSDDTLGSDAGAVYVYERDDAGTPSDSTDDAWSESKLLASDGGAGDRFGLDLSVDGDVLVVGAREDDDQGGNSGAAYVFERLGAAGWVQTAKLLASDGAAGDEFGFSVDIEDDLAIVGARWDDHSSLTDCGSAYVFQKIGPTWSEVAKLSASDAYHWDEFGVSASISGGVALVGAWGNDDATADSGSAYFFTLQTDGSWIESKVVAPDPGYRDNFGRSVSVSGTRAIVGAYMDDEASADQGSAYVYELLPGGWTMMRELLASDGRGSDRFGFDVAAEGDTALVGAYLDDHSSLTDGGSAYALSLSGTGFPSLAVDVASISVSSGGSQTFALNTCTEHVGALYLVVGTASGTSPGTVAMGVPVPLNPDAYTLFSANNPNTPMHSNTLSAFGSEGQASASFNLPAGSSASIVGLTLHHAYGVLASGSLAFVSNAVGVVLVP